MKRKCLMVFLCLALLAGLCSAAPSPETGLKALFGLGEGETLLNRRDVITPGQSSGDWAAIGFALTGQAEDYGGYLADLEAAVTQRYAQAGRLDQNRATEWHRIALTVLALGGDPTAFGRDPQGNPINLVADGTYNYVNADLGLQGINGYLYALLVLDAGDYQTPADSRYTRQDILQAILDSQNPDGGFGLQAGSSDADITAMALQALAPYREGQARQAVENALAYLASVQNPDGGFSSGGQPACESAAQVIIALAALGLDPETALPGGSVVQAMLAYRQPDGSFAHSLDGEGNLTATEQAGLALAAVQRQGSIYDFTQYTPPVPAKTGQEPVAWIALGGGLACAAVVLALLLRRRHRRAA